MTARLPIEDRFGIIPQILAWFLECAGQDADLVTPRTTSLVVAPGEWNAVQSAIRHAAYRTPYSSIDDYMDRWWLLPEILGERGRVHRVRRSDHDRHLHDHPWNFASIILEGGYTEELQIPGMGDVRERRRFRAGDVLFRHAGHRHRLELEDGEECWSLVFTSQNVRDWGFWTENGFVPWRQYAPGSP